MTAKKPKSPRKFHLDKRAEAILAGTEGGDADLLTTAQMADWLGVSIQWLEGRRCFDDGPPFVKLGPRLVRYRRSECNAWLDTRVRRSTAEHKR